MALRKNNQADYDNFADPNKDVLGEPKKVTGENTDKIKKDKKGNLYSLVLDDTQSGLMAGDTIRPGSAPLVDGNGPGSGTGGKYIMGGDYKISKKGKKNYKID